MMEVYHRSREGTIAHPTAYPGRIRILFSANNAGSCEHLDARCINDFLYSGSHWGLSFSMVLLVLRSSKPRDMPAELSLRGKRTMILELLEAKWFALQHLHDSSGQLMEESAFRNLGWVLWESRQSYLGLSLNFLNFQLPWWPQPPLLCWSY